MRLSSSTRTPASGAGIGSDARSRGVGMRRKIKQALPSSNMRCCCERAQPIEKLDGGNDMQFLDSIRPQIIAATRIVVGSYNFV